MKTLLSFVTIIVLAMSFACVGPPGSDGMDGRDGIDGRDGQDANVGVAIYDIYPEEWDGDVNGYATTLIVPEITEKIFYEGAVLVYMIKNEDTDYMSFSQLPYTWLNSGNTEYLDFNAMIGQIEIIIRWVDFNENTTAAPDGLYTFKVVVVEGYKLSTLQDKVQLSDYNAVIDFLGPQAF